MGSKDGIAEKVLSILPPAKNLYDLFGGGFSISHCAYLNYREKFPNVHYNEIDSGIVGLVQDSIKGKYSYDVFKPPFVSREEFFRKKETDAYIRAFWSFGNNQKNYLFGENIEAYKKAAHNLVVFCQLNNEIKLVKEVQEIIFKFVSMEKFKSFSVKRRRLIFREVVGKKLKHLKRGDKGQLIKLERFERLEQLEQLERLQQLKRLQQLEQLERLQQLERLEQLEQLEQKGLSFSSMSYEKVPIKKDSIIYCDPPYENTAEYLNKIDHEKFYTWAKNHEIPVFISSYDINFRGLKCIASISKLGTLAPTGSNKTQEKIYANQSALEYIKAIDS